MNLEKWVGDAQNQTSQAYEKRAELVAAVKEQEFAILQVSPRRFAIIKRTHILPFYKDGYALYEKVSENMAYWKAEQEVVGFRNGTREARNASK